MCVCTRGTFILQVLIFFFFVSPVFVIICSVVIIFLEVSKVKTNKTHKGCLSLLYNDFFFLYAQKKATQRGRKKKVDFFFVMKLVHNGYRKSISNLFFFLLRFPPLPLRSPFLALFFFLFFFFSIFYFLFLSQCRPGDVFATPPFFIFLGVDSPFAGGYTLSKFSKKKK